MQTLNYDWNKFPVDDSWKNKLNKTNTSILDISNEIIRKISGFNKIKQIRMSGCNVAFQDENITLMKSITSLCFCKWNKYIFSEIYLNNIENIMFDMVYKTQENTYYIIYIKQYNNLYLKYEIII